MSDSHGLSGNDNKQITNDVAPSELTSSDNGLPPGAKQTDIAVTAEEIHEIPDSGVVAAESEHESKQETLLEGEDRSAQQERTAIENEAIEHLARRASEMSLNSASAIQSPTIVHRDAKLPAAPPPPTPPEKEAFEFQEKTIEERAKEAGLAEFIDKEAGPAEDKDKQAGLAEHKDKGVVEETANTTQDVVEQTGEEIQHIMDQFAKGHGAPGEREIMSPRLERQQSILQLPPRSSSLESRDTHTGISGEQNKDTVLTGSNRNSIVSVDDTSSMRSHRNSVFQPPPPEPDPALPFDFHRFLEQLRHRTADPVARFLRSFLQEFGKKQWMAHEQVKIIGDFLEFISKKMSQCEVWRTVSDAEFDNAREGMEKLVMNRLYTQTFSPALAPPTESPHKGGKLKTVADGPSGRRGQHQEDVERDDVIAQKIRIYGWIKEEHLDIKPIGDKGRKFLTMAQQELLKINTYRAPRDKVICVLNCCKVIFGFLKNSKSDQSADAFVPLLIYTVLQARPEHLVSNVQYIWRFRNQEKLGGEAGYYMSSLMGVVQFIENLDRTVITISDEDFESHVEQAVSVIAEGHKAEQYEDKSHNNPSAPATPKSSLHLSEKSAPSRPEVTARNSTNVQQSSPRRQKTGVGAGASIDEDETDAMTGLLRTIQKPLSSIGRIFSDDGHSTLDNSRPASTPLPPRTSSRAISPAARLERSTSQGRRSASQRRLDTDDAAAKQASIETAEAQQERQRGYGVVVETLQGMFPNLDKDIIEDVVRAQEGNVGRAVDACLALSDQG